MVASIAPIVFHALLYDFTHMSIRLLSKATHVELASMADIKFLGSLADAVRWLRLLVVGSVLVHGDCALLRLPSSCCLILMSERLVAHRLDRHCRFFRTWTRWGSTSRSWKAWRKRWASLALPCSPALPRTCQTLGTTKRLPCFVIPSPVDRLPKCDSDFPCTVDAFLF